MSGWKEVLTEQLARKIARMIERFPDAATADGIAVVYFLVLKVDLPAFVLCTTTGLVQVLVVWVLG